MTETKPPIVVVAERVDRLEGAKVTYRAATVVATNPGQRLIDVDVANAGKLEGLRIPEGSFFPKIGDEGELRQQGSRVSWVANRLAEGSVGEDELAEPVKQQITVAIQAANGKNTNTYSVEPPPDPDSGDGRVVGDAWWLLDWDAVVQGAWMWTAAGEWVSHTFGDAVFDSVSAAKIVTGILGVGVQVTIGDPNGSHTVIDGARGLVAQVPGVAGPAEVARFGATSGGRDPATGRVTWTISELGHGSFTTASVEGDFTVGGQPIGDLLSNGGGNVVDRYTGTLGSDLGAIASEVGIVEINGWLEAGRIYELSHRFVYFNSLNSSADTQLVVRNIWTGPSSEGSTAVAPAPLVTDSNPKAVTAWYQTPGSAFTRRSQTGVTMFEPTTTGHHRFLLTARRGVGTGDGVYIAGDRDVEFWLKDAGPRPPDSGGTVSKGGGTLVGQAPPPPPSSPKVTRTDTWNAAWSRSWRQSGAVSFNGTMYQGYDGNLANGVQSSSAGFPDLTGVLGGATIQKVELYLYAEHWWNSAGGTAGIGHHQASALPGGYPGIDGYFTVPGWARNQGRWIDVSSWGLGIQLGTIRGISLSPYLGASTPEWYGRFSGANGYRPPAIRIKYTK